MVNTGDILTTRSNTGLAGRLIRLGAALRDEPNLTNHVVIVHHVDAAGTVWGLEGRPGGVGWVNCAKYLASKWTLTNAEQPKTDEQRAKVAELALALLGTPYDWTGIALDAMDAIGAFHLWRDTSWGQAPGHVVCSSYADYVYEQVGLANPGLASHTRTTTPGDWAQFIIERAWEK